MSNSKTIYLEHNATEEEIAHAYTQLRPHDRIHFKKPPKPPRVKPPKPEPPPPRHPSGHCKACGAPPGGAMKKSYEWYTVAELAESLRVAKDTVYSKARTGEWPGVKVAGHWRFDVWTIRQMLKEKWSMRL